ncbi:MAG: hypothetical protein ACPG4N_08545 [Gammaproteobacteria bacterium]
MPEKTHLPREWSSLPQEEQVQCQIEFGRYQDKLPPSCSMEVKIERFREWLRINKGIEFELED